MDLFGRHLQDIQNKFDFELDAPRIGMSTDPPLPPPLLCLELQC